MSAVGGEERDIVLLSGGTGGAKLALGVAEAFGPGRLSVIANSADDIEIYGALVSPDPDLVSFWLAGLIDHRGWGLRGDSFAVMDGLRELGEEIWFNLGDRDLAWCVKRSQLLADGHTQSSAMAALNASITQPVPVLPMSDEPVRTWVSTPQGGWCAFQEFMIRRGAAGPIDGLEFRGVERATPTAEVRDAIAAAAVIVIGPSNPLASIAPILAVPGLAEALRVASAPLVAVSPVVGGEVLKGPTAAFMAFAEYDCSGAGVRDYYGELLDGIIVDEPIVAAPGAPVPAVLEAETRMDGAASRQALARAAVGFARSLA